MITQRKWRVVGILSIGLAAAMTIFGRQVVQSGIPIWALLAYWGVFLLLLLIALYMALLDFKYIRLQYLAGQREIFQETLGSEEFRATLRRASEKDGRQI